VDLPSERLIPDDCGSSNCQEAHVQTITPFLWFDQQAQEAMTFYTSIFKDSRVISSNPMSVQFELLGQRFIGLNAGPRHKFTEAVSFFVEVDTQQEVDHYWDALLAGGGRPDQCGWLKDKFGLSWQVIPKALPQLLTDPDPAKAKRALDAMMKMIKIDLAGLERAHAGT
jgi:predicted 3-demethylubiquinone-9 3-methyltransferase (glyoxalase superfamily)